MPDALALILALAVCYLPGLALLAALRVPRLALMATLAPAVSIAMAGMTAVGAAALGAPFNAATLAVVTGVFGAIAVIRAIVARPHIAWNWQPARIAGIIGVVTIAVGVTYAAATWLRGFGGLRTIPQEHDMILHAIMTAYISRTGNAAPWELVPADVLSGSPVSFYPSGLHLLTAATANLTGDVPQALNAVTVVVLAVAFALSVAALAIVAAEQLDLAPPAPLLAAGLASLVAAGMYRPGFSLMHDGGILSNAATLALTPAVVAGLLLLPRAPWKVSVVVGAACAGLVLTHPSAVASVGVTVVAWWAGLALTRQGRDQLRGLLGRLAIVGVSAVLLILPSALVAYPSLTRTSGFPPDALPASVGEALTSSFGLAYGGYLDPARDLYQLVAAALVVFGVICLIVLRRNFGLVAAWTVWAVITVLAFLAPGQGPASAITGFFYNAQIRVWSHLSLLAPVVVGLGLVITIGWLSERASRHSRFNVATVAAALTLVACLGYALWPALGYARTNASAVAARYSTPDFVRVSNDDLSAMAWLAGHVRPGQRVFNSPNDGSTYLYVYYGIPVVNVYTLGLPGVPYSYRLLQHFDSYPTDQEVRNGLVDLDVAWVYVDGEAPGIGSVGSPEGWAGVYGFTVPAGFKDLDGLPGLTRVFASGSVSVYSLDLQVVRSLP